MKQWLLTLLAKCVLSICRWRYHIEAHGIETLLEGLKNYDQGILIMPNHPALCDPIFLFSYLWSHGIPARPVAVEYVCETPILRWIMKLMRVVPVPNFENSGSSLKWHRGQKSFRRIITGLHRGDCFVVYPSGTLKQSGVEVVGGASWCHRLLQECPDLAPYVVRTEGLWGSMFSRATTGKTPPIGPILKTGIWRALRGGLFFLPKRSVRITITPLPLRFGYQESRLAVNQALEQHYNSYGDTNAPCEPYTYVPYSLWETRPLDQEFKQTRQTPYNINPKKIPKKISQEVVEFVATLAQRNATHINPDAHLQNHLGLDSLDLAEICFWLADRYAVRGLRPSMLSTVSHVMAFAAGQIDTNEWQHDIEEVAVPTSWFEQDRPPVMQPYGRTIPEAFLRTCDRLGNAIACADPVTGCRRYRELKRNAILMAHELQALPGDKIGILLPASVAVYVAIFACHLAGKIPVMINWTVGTTPMESIVQQSQVHAIITSRRFTDEVEGVELKTLAPLFWFLEDMKQRVGIRALLQATVQSYRNADALIEAWDVSTIDPHQPAVVLFTSGTEAQPKGVPLSHTNLLSNFRAILASIPLNHNDALFGMLPPFHSFGFSVTGLLPLLAGVKTLFSPNPTDSLRLAQHIGEWKLSIVCSAPTFLRGILNVAKPAQLSSVRYFVTGAEKAPAVLTESVVDLDTGANLIEGYGITECAPVLTINRPGRAPCGVGQPLPNVDLLAVHPETYLPVDEEQEGLILAKGPNIFTGYLHTTATSPFLEIHGQQWYNTGDLGRINSDGALTLSGRLKRFIKIGGEMISLAALEEVLSKTLPLKTSSPSYAFCAQENEGHKPQIHLFTTEKITLDLVNQALQQGGFSNLVRCHAVHILDALPLTGTGKIAYRQLQQQLTHA